MSVIGVFPSGNAARPGDHRIATDMELASEDNLLTWEMLGDYPDELRSTGIAQARCEHLHGDEDRECGMPLVVSEYGTWFGALRHPLYYQCECRAE